MYYLQSRYYDPAFGRFINADTFATTDAKGFLSCNMFAYCENDPINNADPTGKFIDALFDVASLIGDVIEIAESPGSVIAWASLAADVASLAIPGVSGGGSIVRVIAKSDDILDAAKYADRIFDSAKAAKSNLKLGNELHKMYNPLRNAKGTLNKALKKFGSLLRPDAFDTVNHILYELKPFSKRAFNQAIKQTKQYADTIGKTCTIVIDMYVL